jgi:hypothetical protein
MIRIKFIIGILVTIIFIGSCKKNIEVVEKKNKKNEISIPDNFFANTQVPGIVANKNNETILNNVAPQPNGGFDLNNGDEPIILGNQLTNPYTVTNMQNAVAILSGGNIQSLTATHKYVRFKPNNLEQLTELEDNQDLELQDHPMDYEVIQDGDYYQDPTLGIEEIGWLYTVVPVDYTAPSGYNYEVLSDLYLTDNSMLEDMAESLASGLSYNVVKNINTTITVTREDNNASITMRPVTPCSIDPCQSFCPYDPENPCYGSGGGSGTPPSVIPGIFVDEQTVCDIPARAVPLRQVRVVCKRWFKIWRGYTGDNGQFQCTKSFRNKVKVVVKTKNENAKISKMRGARLWKMFFSCTRRIGVFNNNELATLRYVFTKPTDGSAQNKDLMYWACATTHNSVREFKDYSTEFSLAQPPEKLKIMVSNWGELQQIGAAPMFNKCPTVFPEVLVGAFLVTSTLAGNIVGGIGAVANTLKNRVDVMINFAGQGYGCADLSSPRLKSIIYHELAHSQHFNQAGCGFWTQYRNAIVTEMSKLNQTQFAPYGTGNDASTAPILATGEMWGNHIEYIYSNRHYGNGGIAATPSFFVPMQNSWFANDGFGSPANNLFAIPTLNANLAAIESFDPRVISGDIWHWIPQGLPYDLFDNRNDLVPIIDEVSGYTITQCFNALQSDVRSIPAFRDRLLLQNGNIQQAQVTQLFQRYE